MNSSRVVITGLGVIAPNAHGIHDFEKALKEGQSGIKHVELLKNINMACQLAGIPENTEILKQQYFKPESLIAMNNCMILAGIAAIDCWRDAGFDVPSHTSDVDWDTGAFIGTGIGGADTICERVGPYTTQGKVKKLGSTMVEQTMASACSANIGGLLGLGGQVTTNSSACTTGSESIANAFFAIKHKRAKRILAGSTEGASEYIWSGFDAMRVLARGYNDTPLLSSRPMSRTASGFVPAAGAGMLMLEDFESAQKRGAKIYAEIIAAHVNCGGQRQGGSINAPNPIGVQKCIQQAMNMAGIKSKDIDLINGHLSATKADVLELHNWQQALQCAPTQLPLINSTKSLIGHALGAAGSIECVASILQLHKGFIHGSLNCEDIHPELTKFSSSIVQKSRDTNANILVKASFGFGDVNACLIFKKIH